MRENAPGRRGPRSIKVSLSELELPTYFSQLDPEPRLVANEQLQFLECAGLIRLAWQPGETGHLLEAVALPSSLVIGEGLQRVTPLYHLLGRIPLANQRARLERLLLGERFRFTSHGHRGADWRARALRHVLAQLRSGKSPAPFSLIDSAFNEDVLTALVALAEVSEETPYRVFSVRVFNDSKRLDELKSALVRLARLGCPEWKRLPPDEVLRELNLVANPGYIYLSGPWELVDVAGQMLSLGGFSPAVGLPAIQAAHLQRAGAHALAVLCIENPTTFYEFIRNRQHEVRAGQRLALLCLSGNPSPGCRHLLRLLPDDIPLLVWADLDYGGFNILSQLRKQVNPKAAPYRMDIETLEAHASFAHPLTRGDRRNLERLSRRPELHDVRPLISHILQCGLKLEQEAIRF